MNQIIQAKNSDAFTTEDQLVKTAIKIIKRSAKGTYKIELELDAGVGFADIVMYKRHPRSARELEALATIPPRLAPLFEPSIAARITDRQALASLLGLTEPATQRLVKKLQELDLWKVRSSGPALSSINVQPFQTIIAVEAKLSDWSRALVQAYRNRQFADESWVLLDHRCHKAAIAQLDRFIRSGVGLASIEVNNNLHIHQRPVLASAMSATKRWHAQAALARRVKQGPITLF